MSHEVTEAILRGAVVAVTLYGIWSILRALPQVPADYQPHLLFIAGWMSVTAFCMLSLVAGSPLPYVIEILNTAALFMVGGWATFLTRVTKDIRRFNHQTRG